MLSWNPGIMKSGISESRNPKSKIEMMEESTRNEILSMSLKAYAMSESAPADPFPR